MAMSVSDCHIGRCAIRFSGLVDIGSSADAADAAESWGAQWAGSDLCKVGEEVLERFMWPTYFATLKLRSSFCNFQANAVKSPFKEKQLEIKRQHHFVPFAFLTEWSMSKRNIWYITETGKIREDSARGLGKSEHFYRTCHITPEHVDVIAEFIKNSPEALKEGHCRWLENYIRMQHVFDLYHHGPSHPGMDKFIKAWRSNDIENKYEEIERCAKKSLDELRKGNLEILVLEENWVSLADFVGHQFARTKSFKNRIMTRKKDHPTNEAALMNECWWFIGYISGRDAALSLIDKFDFGNFCLISNNTETPFITSDAPIASINNISGLGILPTKKAIVLPLSPQIAFMIDVSGEFGNGKIDASPALVEAVNETLAKECDKTIFGNSKEAVSKYKALVQR